jgi:hypothetical protein
LEQFAVLGSWGVINVPDKRGTVVGEGQEEEEEEDDVEEV